MTDRDAAWSDLLRRANRGDAAAYARFLSEVAPVVRGIARARLRSAPHEVEDVVQEVLLAVHAKRHTWRESDPVTPWLYAIARYKTADVARRLGRSLAPVPIEDLAEVLPDDRQGEPLAARDLGQMLAGIDARSAGIVRAVGVAGESAGEVGARLGMSDGAVRVAYHRAMARLRRLAGVDDVHVTDEERAARARDPKALDGNDPGTSCAEVMAKDARR